MKTKRSFFSIRQNNSRGKLRKPAVFIIVEASTNKEACDLAEQHISFCEDSGRYADYDNCGCCPCCGHRWTVPWEDKPENPKVLVELIRNNGLIYMGQTFAALIKADGSIVIGSSVENFEDICFYIDGN